MIGVVIWSSESTRKAVIWCEDQGPLAYLRGHDNLLAEADWPVPGDLLRLECETVGNLRHARSVCVIAPNICPQLPDALLGKTNRPSSHLQVVGSSDVRRMSAVNSANDDEAQVAPTAINF